MIRSIAVLLASFALGSGATAATFVLPPEGTDLVGVPVWVHTRYEDTLLDVARDYSVGYEEVQRANPGVDTWIPGVGTRVMLPTRYVLPAGLREGLVINLPEYRMYYFPKPKKGERAHVITYPISIGKMDWNTPIGRHRIISKAENPSWYPPESIRKEHAKRGDTLPRVVPPGPDNPLGAYAMRLNLTTYLIHGTNNPDGVGMRVTSGCIRMFPEHIEQLFPEVDVGTTVHIISEPIKVGWAADTLYVEVHPPLEEESESRLRMRFTNLLREAAQGHGLEIDWRRADEIFSAASGVPTEVPVRRVTVAFEP
ncbi:MAG TPA: L,D-transpeptidase family protein [Gammaproteobacteria bacterium]|nr:L,D-transpeptidase family protein [Gammaproteobacteria bacterium]